MNAQQIATIVTIGDELLIGQVIDTNSAFIAQQLSSIGIAVKHRVAVGDNYNDIWNVLQQESQQANIVFITGGLGPTADDITKPLLCQYFNGKMTLHQPTLQHVTHLFETVFKRPITERNIKQAEVPDCCTVIHNQVGTAPAMQFVKNSVQYFALPGVPHEMKWIMTHQIIPLLQQRNIQQHILHKTLITAGIGESMLADRLVDFESNLPQHISLAYLPNYGMVRLRLTAMGNDKTWVEETIQQQFSILKNVLHDVMICDEDITLSQLIGNLLVQHNSTISTAESCTGGYIAHLFTSLPGSSNYYKGSIVSYDNSVKENMLHVPSNIIEQYGAVSYETVEYMAKNVLQILNTDYAIATSGIMGPTGETPAKPIGTVWIAVASKQTVKAKLFNLRLDRKRNIELTAMHALLQIRELIVDKQGIT